MQKPVRHDYQVLRLQMPAKGRDQASMQVAQVRLRCQVKGCAKPAHIFRFQAELGELELQQPEDIAHVSGGGDRNDLQVVCTENAGVDRTSRLVVLQQLRSGWQLGANLFHGYRTSVPDRGGFIIGELKTWKRTRELVLVLTRPPQPLPYPR